MDEIGCGSRIEAVLEGNLEYVPGNIKLSPKDSGIHVPFAKSITPEDLGPGEGMQLPKV